MKKHSRLEAILCHNHHRKFCHLVGNGTAGLYLSLKSLGIHNKNVALPNGVCPNVVMAVYFSGNKPIYLDIDRATLGLSVNELHKCKKKFEAVIAVHAYGSVCDIESIQNYCSANNIPLIEDMAVAMGAVYKGQPAGSFGNMSVISFGSGKIIDVGHGGAILTNDRNIIENIIMIEKGLNQFCINDEQNINEFGKYHTQLYNNHYGIDHAKYHNEFKKTSLSFKKNYLFKFSRTYENQIIDELTLLHKNIDSRRAKADHLTNLFSVSDHNRINLFLPLVDSVYWRYCIFLEEDRNKVLKYLLGKKYKISSWFPSADLFFEGERARRGYSTPISDKVGNTILNIWVNKEVDISYLESIHREIISCLHNPSVLT